MMKKSVAIKIIAVLIFIFTNSTLSAQNVQSLRLSILAGKGFGKTSKIAKSIDAGLQAFGNGYGVRAEYVFKEKFTLGAVFVMHTGENYDLTKYSANYSSDDKYETRILYGGLEFGICAPIVYIFECRPYLQIGYCMQDGAYPSEVTISPLILRGIVQKNIPLNSSVTLNFEDFSPYVLTGFELIANIKDPFFAGIDVYYMMAPDIQSDHALGIFLSFGVNLTDVEIFD